MIYECPNCGAWEGRADGEGVIVSRWCAECTERRDCAECEEEKMDELIPPGAEFAEPYDAVLECETEPDFDAEED